MNIAARYAEKVLEADRDMLEKTIAFDRSMRTVIIGSCAFLPIHTLMPLLQEHFMEKAITSEIVDDNKLIVGLKNHIYQLAILHKQPDDKNIFCQRYLDEHLYVTVPPDQILASRKTLSFADLEGMSILAHGSSGFWLDICRENLKETNQNRALNRMTELLSH